MNKRLILIPLSCVLMIGALSGCGKKMDYDTTELEKQFDVASQYSDIYKSKLGQAVTGDLYETVEGANNLFEEALENAKNGKTEQPYEVVDKNGRTRYNVNGIAPDLVISEMDIEGIKTTKTETGIFLQEEFEITSYKGTGTTFGQSQGGYPAWKYEKVFTGTQSSVYDQLFKLVNKVDKQYEKAKYFDDKYKKLTASGFGDINNYMNLYKVVDGRFYVVSTVKTQANKNNPDENKGIYQLWFFDTKKHQNLDFNDYGKEDAIRIFEKMIKEENIPSDFSLHLFGFDYTGIDKMRLEDLYSAYGYGKATSPFYKGIFDIMTLEPDETAEPEVTPTPTPDPELIVDNLIIDNIQGDESVESDNETEPTPEPTENTDESLDDTDLLL